MEILKFTSYIVNDRLDEAVENMLYSESHLLLSMVNVIIRLMWSYFIVPY